MHNGPLAPQIEELKRLATAKLSREVLIANKTVSITQSCGRIELITHCRSFLEHKHSSLYGTTLPAFFHHLSLLLLLPPQPCTVESHALLFSSVYLAAACINIVEAIWRSFSSGTGLPLFAWVDRKHYLSLPSIQPRDSSDGTS